LKASRLFPHFLHSSKYSKLTYPHLGRFILLISKLALLRKEYYKTTG